MPQTPKEKGDLLEYAVALIEKSLLARDPKLRGCPALVERGKRFPGPIPTDADVWVTIAPDSPYQTYHIFECKNWQAPVGTDIIDGLNSKRARLKAASATIVARSFTAPARALAKATDVTLLEASEELLPIEVFAPLLSTTPVSQQAEIFFADRNESAPKALEADGECLWVGKKMRLMDVLAAPIDRHMRSQPKDDPRYRLEGRHSCSTSFALEFDPGEMLLAGREVRQIGIQISYVVEVVFPQFTFKVGVENRGGLIQLTYPPGTAGHESLVMEILTKPVPRG